MSDEMRETIINALAKVDGWSKAPPISDRRPRYDLYSDAILALITAELERVERERDEALRMWPNGKLPSKYTCLTGDGWVLAGDKTSIDRVIRQDHEARAYWPATIERLKAAEARATAAEARLAEAMEVMRRIAAYKLGGPHRPGQVKAEHRAMIERARTFMEQQG